MIPLRPLRVSIGILATSILLAVAICWLPQDNYQRWKLLDGGLYYWTRWIYERCHFDPTPIDVAIIGPSRTLRGIDAPRLSRALAARGLPSNVVNFSIPKTGRNANYVIVQELLSEKHPKVMIVGIMDRPYDYGHEAFKYIAPTVMLLNPAYPTNLNYPNDVLYLPFRQTKLFTEDLLPHYTGVSKTFDPAHYLGSSPDTTANFVRPDGTVVEGIPPPTVRDLTLGERNWEVTVPKPLLGVATAPLQFGDEHHFIRLIAEAAEARGVRVEFLFIPGYSGPSQVLDQPFYERFGPVLKANFVRTRPEWYSMFSHLNREGAQQLTDWLVAPVAAALTAPASQAPAAERHSN
jgi:hypothetical protein